VESTFLGQLLMLQGWFLHFDGNRLKSGESLRSGKSILRRVGFGGTMAMLLYFLGWAAEEIGGYEATRRIFDQALAFFRQRNDLWGAAWTLNGCAYMVYMHHQNEEAWRLAEESLAVFRAIGDRWGATWVLGALGEWAAERGAHDEAWRFYEEALIICKAVGDPGGVTWNLGKLAATADLLQDADNFWLYNAETLRTRLQIGIVGLVGNHEIYLMARQLEMEGQAERAVEMFTLSLGHPQILQRQAVRDQVTLALDRLKAQLSPEVFNAAVQRGKSSDLESIIGSHLERFAPPNKPATALPQEPSIPDTTLVESLSQRELDILRLIADGLSSRETAERLFLSVGTIRWYLKQIYEKLGVHSRTQAIARARELNLLV
jgi:DNA-binding CsgD family transcriptional regulator